ncbi:MAG: hypothetical protein AB4041_11530 [Microcystaceae cyanobacterium]
MADVKTILRELSVAYYIHCLINNIAQNDLTPQDFAKVGQEILTNSDNLTVATEINKVNNLPDFAQHQEILKNAKKLAQIICSHSNFQLSNTLNIHWVGSDTAKQNNTDLVINSYEFSLKEDSYILRNMGLYYLIHCLTGQERQRGLHIFREYALHEFNQWFLYTYKGLIEYLRNNNNQWIYLGKSYQSSITLEKENLIFFYKRNNHSPIKTILPLDLKSEQDFNSRMNSKITEYTFSKWINQHFAKDSQYLRLKKSCSEQAGTNLIQFLTSNLSYNNSQFKRLLQIYPNTYYYAKSTEQGQYIYQVPSDQEFTDTVQVSEITYQVTRSQLNILTTLLNTTTQKELILRNELRYSHGQFKGTPEAKLYLASDEKSLESIYIPIYPQ